MTNKEKIARIESRLEEMSLILGRMENRISALEESESRPKCNEEEAVY